MKSKKRPRVSTKKCPIHEVKKVQRLKRKEKERNNNNNKKKRKRRGPRLSQARGYAARRRISIRLKDM